VDAGQTSSSFSGALLFSCSAMLAPMLNPRIWRNGKPLATVFLVRRASTRVKRKTLPSFPQGASQICEAFSGGRTFLSATGRVGGREARGWRRGAEGWKIRAVSLRAKRSNLGSRGNGDCFASLAMTQRGYGPPALLRKTQMHPFPRPASGDTLIDPADLPADLPVDLPA